MNVGGPSSVYGSTSRLDSVAGFKVFGELALLGGPYRLKSDAS